MDTVVRVEGLVKTYGTTVAVDGISFDVREGEIFGIVGPNGAGKTTAIECLEGLRRPDRGAVSVLDLDPQRDGRVIRMQTGVQLQQSSLPERMKVWEALDLYASFYPRTIDGNELLSRLGLGEKRNAHFARLSGGQKQRLYIALALINDPRLVFLDELTTGLDPQARHAIWDLVRDVRSKGKTVLLTTHFMEEAERLCDRVLILDHGRIVALDTPAALVGSLGGEERVAFSVDSALPEAFARALSGVALVEVQGDRVIVRGTGERQVPLVVDVVGLLAKLGIRFRELRTEQPTLEDVFLKLTGSEIRE
jgi:ABC-2 type transport system ATP-binding protein